MMKKSMQLHYKKTIDSWFDGVLLGNGSLGAVIWGGARELKFGVDRLDLWDITPDEKRSARILPGRIWFVW